MTNQLMDSFNSATQALYDHVGFVEDWVVLPIDDQTSMMWMIKEGAGGFVRYAETEQKLLSDGDYYMNDIYRQRFYPKWVYRGKTMTMVMVDTRTDGNRFFQFFDNAKEMAFTE